MRAHPTCDRDRFIGGIVENNDDLELFVADILDVVTEALRHIAHVAGAEFIDASAAMRSEHRHPRFAMHIILPFGGIGMPMQLAEAAWIDEKDGTRHGRRNGELIL